MASAEAIYQMKKGGGFDMSMEGYWNLFRKHNILIRI